MLVFGTSRNGQWLRRIRGGRWVIAIALALLSGSRPASAGPILLVGGQLSNNVVRFELDTGAASLYGTFAPVFAAPRELAMNDQGQLFASTADFHRHVMKFVAQPGTDVLTAVDFTPSIGEFGPGQIQFYQGDLYVAGGSTRVIHHYNGQTGALIRTFSVATDSNIRGMTIVGDSLYYAEIFQERIRVMDLTQTPPTGGTLFQDTSRLFEPASMTSGVDGHLLFTNRENTFVQEYDRHTGAFIRTVVDLSVFNPGLNLFDNLEKGIAYYPALDQYFVSAKDAVYRLDSQGNLLQTYQSSLLKDAYGLLVVPEPGSLAMLLIGFAGFAVLCRRRTGASSCAQAKTTRRGENGRRESHYGVRTNG